MKKLMAKFLAVCLVLSILPISAFATYSVPNYAVTLNASEDRIYKGDSVEISFNINSEDFLMTDMSVAYDADYFTGDNDTAEVVEFSEPELKGKGATDGEGGYNLGTKFTFTANDVTDTIKVDFDIASASIVHSYESARDGVDPAVTNVTGTSVIIVKQYDVTFEENGTPLSEQTIDKGLDEANEADTVISVPSVSYDAYVGDGLVADYYEHVWTYNGNEYTDEEIAAFGQAGSANEITEDTTFVLVVRPQTFSVTVPADSFDTTVTPDEATYGEDYEGKINPDEYDDKYDYTVKYEIGGNEQTVDCVGDSFTIPGANIIGDMTLSYEKELNITIKAYAEYVNGGFLITVDGAAAGYTFDGYEMYKSENHDNLRAWVYMIEPGTQMTEAQAEEIAEDLIFTSTTGSPDALAGYDINGVGGLNLDDVALVHGAYTVSMKPVNEWVKQYLCADVNHDEGTYYKVNTLDYNKIVEEYKK